MIKDVEHFNRGWVDYGPINEVLPRGMRFSDIDACLHSNGFFLILEIKMFKPEYTPEATLRNTIKPGQANLHYRISQLLHPDRREFPAVTVFRVATPYTEDHTLDPKWVQVVVDGKQKFSGACDIKGLQRAICRWLEQTENAFHAGVQRQEWAGGRNVDAVRRDCDSHQETFGAPGR